MQGIPADDTSFRVPQGESAYMEPAVYAVGTTDTVLRVIRIPGFDRAFPRGQHARKVITMNNVGGAPSFQFVKRHAEIIEALLTDEFELAFGCHSNNKAGNAINDQAKTLFAIRQKSFTLPELFFRLLALDALCDAICEVRQSVKGALSKRFLGEHAHNAHDPILDNERVAGEGGHLFISCPVLGINPRID